MIIDQHQPSLRKLDNRYYESMRDSVELKHCIQLKKSSEAASSTSSSSAVTLGLVLPTTITLNPKSVFIQEQRKLLSRGNSEKTDSVVACSSSSSGAECGGGAGSSSAEEEEGVKSTLLIPPLTPTTTTPTNYQLNINNNHEESLKESNSNNSSRSSRAEKICSKMFTCRVLLVLLLVKCLILSFVIPAHLIPTGNSEYPAPPDYEAGGESHGEEDGFDNNIMLDDSSQPLPLTLKNDILNLVDNFDIPSQPATIQPVEGDNGHGNGVEEPPTTSDSTSKEASPANGNGNGSDGNGSEDANGGGGGNGADEESTATPDSDAGEPAEAVEDSGNGSDTNAEPANGNGSNNGGDAGGDDNASDAGETSQGEDAGEAASDSESSTATASAASSSENGGGGNENGGGASNSCPSNSGGDGESMQSVLEKLENLMEAVKNIDTSIDKMETLVQSTMIDERVYKCMSAIQNGNQTQAQKYWKQILRYLSTPQKQAAILNQLIRDSYGGSQDQILPVIQFIEQTSQFYGYHTLFKELPKYNHLYRNTAVFTLGHHIKKSCGRDSAIYKSLPSAVQSVLADFFTLQNKHNKGYLYYAKRCVAKHYHHCLDVLTKRIDPYVLDGLADDSEEKRRYHWKLNATDSTVTKFFILNHDKYWTYRLQDLNNSPRFKMEEAGSNADIELARFQLKLNTDDEIMIQVRDSDDYLEEEDFKSDKAEVRLHSFHQTDGIPDSPRMFWLVNSVTSANGVEQQTEPDSCNMDLAAVPSSNGNGSSK